MRHLHVHRSECEVVRIPDAAPFRERLQHPGTIFRPIPRQELLDQLWIVCRM